MKLPKELTTVTPLSKSLALFLFFALPIVAFLFGMQYQQSLDLMQMQKIFAEPVALKRVPTPTPQQIVIPTQTLCQSNADCKAGQSCKVQGPLIQGQPLQKKCVAPGQMSPL